MGCLASSPKVRTSKVSTNHRPHRPETIVAALTRIDEEITAIERAQPAARLAVVVSELDTLQQEIKSFEEATQINTKDNYAQTMHQMFTSLDLYRHPLRAAENEDFIANVNRKEMQRLELSSLRKRHNELQREKGTVQAQLLKLRSLYSQLQHLLGSIWTGASRPGSPIEIVLKKAVALRDALSSVSARLRAAAEYVHAAARLLDDALPAWKLTGVGKSGWERTSACADTCRYLVEARCLERSARRVLAAHAAPRAARTLRLALDYAFTDAMHDHKYKRAFETFLHFKEALVQLIESIHQVLLNNLENLAVAEKDVVRYRRELRAARVNAIVRKGLAELRYEPSALNNLKLQTNK